MYEFKINKIVKEDFLKLDERDVMFITNPGRMDDEDGSTFILKNGNEYVIYRVDDWMYPNGDEDKISMEDVAKQFPKWYEAWKYSVDKNYHGKYKYLYMGFGNGLCVDNSIYDEFEQYLNRLVEKEGKSDEIKYVVIYNGWKKAFIDMVEDKEIID